MKKLSYFGGFLGGCPIFIYLLALVNEKINSPRDDHPLSVMSYHSYLSMKNGFLFSFICFVILLLIFYQKDVFELDRFLQLNFRTFAYFLFSMFFGAAAFFIVLIPCSFLFMLL